MLANWLVWLMTPGAADHRRDMRRAADHVIIAEDRRDPLDAVDAVLQGDHARVPGRPVALPLRPPSRCPTA